MIDLNSLPEIDLRQLLNMTDDTGILQHATAATPDRHHGYCTDDNARALIAAIMEARLHGYDESRVPLQRYLAFMAYALNTDTGRFRNFMGYDRRWLEEVGSEDSHARGVWSLGVAAAGAPNESIYTLANRLLHQSAPALATFDFLRSWAFGIVGLNAYLAHYPNDAELTAIRDDLSDRLFDAWTSHAEDDWPWWEDILTYANAKLPHALVVTGKMRRRDDMIEAGLKALAWVHDIQTASDGHLSIIGNKGWYVRGQKMAKFDQQPLEAHGLVHACVDAAEVTGDSEWAERALGCFEWFLGRNDLGLAVAQTATGGCHDGLLPDGVNANQGAESSLAYLLSLLHLAIYREHPGFHAPRPDKVQPVSYGLAGVSKFGEFCVAQYEDSNWLRPAAVWNRTASKAERMASMHHLAHRERIEDLAKDPDVELVHVATIPALHAEHALPMLEAGKHVLCEKPLATKLADADKLIDAARAHKAKLSVNFPMRFGPLWKPMAELIRSGTLGHLLRGEVINCAGDDALTADHWFWDESRSGGIFIEQGVHFFDLVRSWLGPGKAISAFRRRRPESDIVDQVGCTVAYGNQATVSFYHGFHQPSSLDRQRMTLVFEMGEVILSGWVADRLTIRAVVDSARREALEALFPNATVETERSFTGPQRTCRHRGVEEPVDSTIRMTWQSKLDKQAVYGRALRELIDDLARAIRDPERRPRIAAVDGRAALELAVAADRLSKGETP